MPMPLAEIFPDVEELLVNYLPVQNLVPEIRGYTYLTILPPAALDNPDDSTVYVRVNRTSGADRSIRVERPIVDIDVYSRSMDTSQGAARLVSQAVRSMRAVKTPDGVVNHVRTIIGPRWMPDVNPQTFRVGASFEFHTHR